MSEILGYDINRRPLRAGDRVVPTAEHVAEAEQMPPWPWTIEGPSRTRPAAVALVERKSNGRIVGAECDFLRRLDDRTDHQPCGESFSEIMDRIKRREGVPA